MNMQEMMEYLNSQRKYAEHALEDAVKNFHNAAMRYTVENANDSLCQYITGYAAQVDNARKRVAEVKAQIEAMEHPKI